MFASTIYNYIQYITSLACYLSQVVDPASYFSVDEDEIELQTTALRKQLADDSADSRNGARDLKPHQVHELAEAKIVESEKLRKALGIREDYEEGSHWRKQQERVMAARRVSTDELKYE